MVVGLSWRSRWGLRGGAPVVFPLLRVVVHGSDHGGGRWMRTTLDAFDAYDDQRRTKPVHRQARPSQSRVVLTASWQVRC
jgi:hypothetical protein